MSAADAIYGLRELLRGDDVEVDRLFRGVSYLGKQMDEGNADPDIQEAFMLLCAYAQVYTARYVSSQRRKVGKLYIPAVQRCAESVKGA